MCRLVFSRGAKVVAAADITSSTALASVHTHGLRSFLELHPRAAAFVLSPVERERLLDGRILVTSWDGFILDRLPTL